MKDARDIIIRPVITEKGTQSMTQSKYTFEVTVDSNKPEIKRAVEELFKVRVRNVNTINVVGKKRRIGWQEGKKKDWKKAIVTLEEGDTIPLFEGV